MAFAFNLILVLIGVWNVVNIVGVALFLYYAYGVKDDMAVRRWPILHCVQIFCLNVWVNCLIQRSGLHYYYAPINNAINNPLAGYFIISMTCPLYIGFSLTTDYFSTRKLALEEKATTFDWHRDLTPLERRFFWLQQRMFGSGKDRNHESGDLEPVAGDSRGGGGSSHDIVRRYQSSVVRRVVGYVLGASVIMLALGLLIAGCFPLVTNIGKCSEPPQYLRLFIPLMVFNLVDLVFIPVLLYLLRNIRDVHYIRNETLFNYCLIVGIFIAQLVVDLPPLEFPDPLGGFFFQLVGLPVTSLTMIYFPVLCCVRNQHRLRSEAISVQHTPEVFEKILKDKHMMEELKKVLEESYCLENGLFWTDYQDALKLFGTRTASDVEKANTIRKLYKNYIAPGSPRELNLRGGTSAAITKLFRAGRLTIESFEPVRVEVFHMMYMNSFPKLIEHIKTLTGTVSRGRISGLSSSAPAHSGFA